MASTVLMTLVPFSLVVLLGVVVATYIKAFRAGYADGYNDAQVLEGDTCAPRSHTDCGVEDKDERFD